MQRKLTLAAALFFAVSIIAISLNVWEKDAAGTALTSNSGPGTVQIGGRSVTVSIASTPEARARGLGGRASLAGDEGMLFVFDSDAKYRFWMKDMRFPIDILWLSSDGNVVDMRENVFPETYPEVFTPVAPARYVLELPAGLAKAYSVKVGDIVRL